MTTSPIFDFLFLDIGMVVLFALAILLRASFNWASSGVGSNLSKLIFEKSIKSILGKISTLIVYSKSLPSSKEVTCISGCEIGRMPLSSSAWREESPIALSKTSPIT